MLVVAVGSGKENKMDPQILALLEMLKNLNPEQMGSLLKLGGQGRGEAEGADTGAAEAPPNVFGGRGLLSDENLLYTGGAGQPGAAQFAPQSYKGVPTFTGGVPYKPSDYEKVHALMSLLNNIMAGAKAGGGGM